jgi:hypothetical protein
VVGIDERTVLAVPRPRCADLDAAGFALAAFKWVTGDTGLTAAQVYDFVIVCTVRYGLANFVSAHILYSLGYDPRRATGLKPLAFGLGARGGAYAAFLARRFLPLVVQLFNAIISAMLPVAGRFGSGLKKLKK